MALLPGEDDVSFTVDLARRIARERSPGTSVLLTCDGPSGWRPLWGVEPAVNRGSNGSPGSMRRLEAVPGFAVETYPFSPEDARPDGA